MDARHAGPFQERLTRNSAGDDRLVDVVLRQEELAVPIAAEKLFDASVREDPLHLHVHTLLHFDAVTVCQMIATIGRSIAAKLAMK